MTAWEMNSGVQDCICEGWLDSGLERIIAVRLLGRSIYELGYILEGKPVQLTD